MTLRNWMVRPLVLVAIAAMVLVFLPVERVFANEVAPETKSETLTEVPVESSEVVGDTHASDEAFDVEGEDDVAADDATDDTRPDGDSEDLDARIEGQSEDEPEMQESTEEGDTEAGGAVLRERSEPMETPMPFTGLGFTGPGAEGPDLYWRALLVDGTWTDWNAVEILDEFDGPDPGSDEEREAGDRARRWASDAIWVGAATHLQLQVEGAALSDVEVTLIDSAGLTETLLAKATRTLKSLGTAPPAEASTQPRVRSRADWGADESCTSGTISYARPRATIIHHTATKSDYTREEVPQQIRNMYHWHTACHGSGNNWNDIGYNFIIDRFGQIWEARRGGIDRGVIGAHAGGWNTGTFGVAFMGNYNDISMSTASLNAAQGLIAWKYDIHDIDASADAWTYLNSQWIPTLTGHRNVRGSYVSNPTSTTDCPGQRIYTRMDEIRLGVDAFSLTWIPVVGDWNGNGTTTIGWYRDGQWRLRNSNSAGSPHLTINYGKAGDLPIVGDWNGNGQTTIGVVRGQQWLLRNSNSGGSPNISFKYGRGEIDFPMAGDWNRDGRDTPAIVRDGRWHLRNSHTGGPSDISFTYGRVTQGDFPVVGDWNGDGRDTPGILRDGRWHLRDSLSGGSGDYTFTYGRLTLGDDPVVGDWNATGRTTVGVARGADWHLRNSLSGGPAHLSFTYR